MNCDFNVIMAFLIVLHLFRDNILTLKLIVELMYPQTYDDFHLMNYYEFLEPLNIV
jgi:hypothetical protein